MGLLSRKKSNYKRIKPVEQIAEEDIPQEEVDKVLSQSQEVEEVVEEKPKERIMVVKEIPVREIRKTKAKDGTIIHFMTTEEALTEFLNS